MILTNHMKIFLKESLSKKLKKIKNFLIPWITKGLAKYLKTK